MSKILKRAEKRELRSHCAEKPRSHLEKRSASTDAIEWTKELHNRYESRCIRVCTYMTVPEPPKSLLPLELRASESRREHKRLSASGCIEPISAKRLS